ncbi:hypothetical protein DRW03_13415 [Corallococcus sp. H22C18031201]|nr:hypothetical protein DRW03_13415 [Corallococcus sp. H22C18031201]
MVSIRPLALSFLVVLGLVAACGGDPPHPTETPDGSVPLVCTDGGTTACGDACVAIASDPAHCGGCDTVCATGESCVLGVCLAPCSSRETLCGMACVDTASDAANCGGCDTECATGESCVQGVCLVPCSWGETLCGVACVDTASDAAHCGGCDTECAMGESCVQGVCSAACSTSETRCGAACVNTTSDSANCGACGVACSAGQSCVSGSCAVVCVIGGQQVTSGTVNAANACEQCMPATSATAWTPRADGTQCGSGQFCSAGACASGCFIGGKVFTAGTPNPANACEVCAPATSTTAWTARARIPLLVGGADIAPQGWTRIEQSPSSLTYGADYVRLETSTASKAPTSGQLLIVRSNAFDPTKPYAIRVTMQVESVNKHNSLDSGAALLAGFTPAVGNTTERSQMVYLDSSAIGWADDTQAAAFPVTDGLFHVYELSVNAAKVATLSVDGIAKLTRNNFTSNGTLAIGDQTNDPNVDGVMRIQSVELRCQ